MDLGLDTQVLIHNPVVYRKYCEDAPDDFAVWFSESFPEGTWIINPRMLTGVVSMLTQGKSDELKEGENIAVLISKYIAWVRG